jgi:3-oxoadipate enol-lactonase
VTVRRPLLRAVGLAAGGWAAWRLLGPELPRRYPPGQVRPVRMTGRTVLVGEREFFVRECGPPDAPPLVLIHGWSLDGEMTFGPLVARLGDRHRIVVPDLRNHGKSDWIRGHYEVADLADEVAGVLDAVGVRRATVMGYSLGGMVTMELARRAPYLVGRMILAATAARPVPEYRALARVAFWAGRVIARISTKEAALITTQVLLRSGSIAPTSERWLYEGLLRRDGGLFYEAGAAAYHFDARQWVGLLTQPAVVVIPTRDLLVPVRAQLELAGLLPEARVVELDGAGHESILTRVDDYVDVIEAFTESCAGNG